MLSIALVGPVAAQQPETQDPTAKALWTVLVFLNADNNLESFGVRDFREMARIGSTDKVNVIVQMDRNPGFSATTQIGTIPSASV
jgi:hypothetical protein